MNAEQLLNYKLPTWSVSPTHFATNCKDLESRNSIMSHSIQGHSILPVIFKRQLRLQWPSIQIFCCRKIWNGEKVVIFSNMRGLNLVIMELQIRFPEFSWYVFFSGESLKLHFMLATSAFGKSEKGYLISITVEIVAGLSFSRGY